MKNLYGLYRSTIRSRLAFGTPADIMAPFLTSSHPDSQKSFISAEIQ